MRLRMQDVNGDRLFGRGGTNFFVDSSAGVGQLVETRLLLWEGEWFLDQTDGTPYAQEVLGINTGSTYDLALQQRILGTQGVTSIETYFSSCNPVTRVLTVSGTVNTLYSATPVPFSVTL